MMQRQDITSKLLELGYRLTPQRMMVVSAIESSDEQLSAEEIHGQVVPQYPHVNISTVYRTLELLKRLGLIAETDLGGGRVRYYPAGKEKQQQLICQQCGKTINMDDSILNSVGNMLFRQYRFNPDLKHLSIFGRCAECQKKLTTA
jgi:Fur family ferric uptake transcriptional regulator